MNVTEELPPSIPETKGQPCCCLLLCGHQSRWKYDFVLPITYGNIDLRAERAHCLVLDAPEYGGVFQFWK